MWDVAANGAFVNPVWRPEARTRRTQAAENRETTEILTKTVQHGLQVQVAINRAGSSDGARARARRRCSCL